MSDAPKLNRTDSGGPDDRTANHRAEFRFYEELNDFLPPDRRKRPFSVEFGASPTVGQAVAALGVPPAEVDLILVNGDSVDFRRTLADGDRVSVYPVFESFDIAPLTRLRPAPLRRPAFILDTGLGALTRRLRLLGIDARDQDPEGPDIVEISLSEGRAILTRNSDLLRRTDITHGYFLRSETAEAQIREVVERFDLGGSLRRFSR